MIQAVLFDIDNTLYPYAPSDAAGTAAMRHAFAQIVGTPADAAAFSDLLHQAKQYVKAHTANTAACHNRMLYAQRLCELAGCFSAENALTLYHAYWDAYLSAMTLFDGAESLLRQIRASGKKLGFCTDLTAQIQMRKLAALGLSDIADAVVTSEESGIEKPAPLPYQLLLEKLGVAPEQAVMIGDDEQKDIRGACTLGMRAIAFGEASGYSVCARNYRELSAILKEWKVCD